MTPELAALVRQGRQWANEFYAYMDDRKLHANPPLRQDAADLLRQAADALTTLAEERDKVQGHLDKRWALYEEARDNCMKAEARVESAERERDTEKARADIYGAGIVEWRERIATLEAENARLKEVVTKAEKTFRSYDMQIMAAAMREALAPSSPAPAEEKNRG